MNKKIFLLLLLTNTWLVANALLADQTKPIKIDANHATIVNQKQVQSEFSGNVIITRGSIMIHCDLAKANQDEAGSKTLFLYGKPVIFSQIADDGSKIEGQSNEFSYSTKTNLAILRGRARIKKGNNLLIGDVLTYNTSTHQYSAASSNVNNSNNGRITVILDQADLKNTGVPKKLNK